MRRKPKKETKFKVGDIVEYYSVMNPLSELKGAAKVLDIGPMHEGGDDMMWLEGVRGAWHPDACKIAIKSDGVL
jgi:hypothetical protein